MKFALKIDPKKRASGRYIAGVRDALVHAVIAAEQDGISRAEIARRIGCNRSRITRQLRGTSDLTLRSIAEIAWAINMIPQFSLEKDTKAGTMSNEVKAQWLDHSETSPVAGQKNNVVNLNDFQHNRVSNVMDLSQETTNVTWV